LGRAPLARATKGIQSFKGNVACEKGSDPKGNHAKDGKSGTWEHYNKGKGPELSPWKLVTNSATTAAGPWGSSVAAAAPLPTSCTTSSSPLGSIPSASALPPAACPPHGCFQSLPFTPPPARVLPSIQTIAGPTLAPSNLPASTSLPSTSVPPSLSSPSSVPSSQLPADPQPPTSLNSLLGEFTAQTQLIVSKSVQESQTQIQHHLDQTVHTLIHKLDANTQRQFAQQQSHLTTHDQQLHSLHTTLNALQEENKKIWSELTVCKQSAALAADVPASLKLGEELTFNAAPNATIVKAHCKDLISADALRNALAAWLSKCSLREGTDFDLLGDVNQLSGDWVLGFRGAPGIAARTVALCLRKLRIAKDVYEEFWGQNPNAGWCQIYVSSDKNNLQVATETQTKRFATTVGTFMKEKKQGEVTSARREGLVMVGGMPFAILAPQPDHTTHVRWNDTLVEKVAHDNGHGSSIEFKQKVLSAFADSAPPSSGAAGIQAKIQATSWCP